MLHMCYRVTAHLDGVDVVNVSVNKHVDQSLTKIKLIIRCVLQWLDAQHDTRHDGVYRQLHYGRRAAAGAGGGLTVRLSD